MKRAFTLIELLVVIAIIAILAAILFPVFAQAKVAAKKTQVLSNTKQQNLGLIMYAGDYDDIYPRQDECVMFSSLNSKFKAPAFNDTALEGCNGPFYNRTNNFSWQKWPQPYVKNVDLFFNPLREKVQTEWDNNGQLNNQFLLNNGLTGSLFISNLATGQVGSRGRRNSWLGGSLTAIPSPSEAMIIMEVTYNLGVLPVATDDTKWNTTTQDITAYPTAFREYWKNKVNKTPNGVADCFAGTVSNEVDTNKAVTGGLTLGFSDGSAKFMAAGRFLARSPTKQEMVGASGGATAGYTFQNDCHGMPNGGGTAGNLGILPPNTSIQYPMWGLGG